MRLIFFAVVAAGVGSLRSAPPFSVLLYTRQGVLEVGFDPVIISHHPEVYTRTVDRIR